MDGNDEDLIAKFLKARKSRNKALDVMEPIHTELSLRVRARGPLNTDAGDAIITHDTVRQKNKDDIAALVASGKIKVTVKHVAKLHVEPPSKGKAQ